MENCEKNLRKIATRANEFKLSHVKMFKIQQVFKCTMNESRPVFILPYRMQISPIRC